MLSVQLLYNHKPQCCCTSCMIMFSLFMSHNPAFERKKLFGFLILVCIRNNPNVLLCIYESFTEFISKCYLVVRINKTVLFINSINIVFMNLNYSLYWYTRQWITLCRLITRVIALRGFKSHRIAFPVSILSFVDLKYPYAAVSSERYLHSFQTAFHIACCIAWFG